MSQDVSLLIAKHLGQIRGDLDGIGRKFDTVERQLEETRYRLAQIQSRLWYALCVLVTFAFAMGLSFILAGGLAVHAISIGGGF